MAENITNLNVVTASALEQSQTEIWNAMKNWVMSNIDSSNLMTIVKDFLDVANREIIGTTGTEKAQAVATAVTAMVNAFETAGLSMSGVTTSQFADCILALSNNNGVYILDTNNNRWTAAQWAYEKEQQGHDPATCQGILIVNPDHNFLVASNDYGPMQFGTNGHTIPNLQSMNGGLAGTPKDGTYNSRKIMAATDPDKVRDEFKVVYFSGMTGQDLIDKDIVFFPDAQTLTDWATLMGIPELYSIGTSMIYALPHDTEPNHYVLKYYSGNGTSLNFSNREAIAPYTDSNSQTGCTALNQCYYHVEYAGDTTYWRLPSLFELLLIYLNKLAINQCRSALGKGQLPTINIWSCLQFNSNAEQYMSLADGSFGNNSKYFQFYVVVVAS